MPWTIGLSKIRSEPFSEEWKMFIPVQNKSIQQRLFCSSDEGKNILQSPSPLIQTRTTEMSKNWSYKNVSSQTHPTPLPHPCCRGLITPKSCGFPMGVPFAAEGILCLWWWAQSHNLQGTIPQIPIHHCLGFRLKGNKLRAPITYQPWFSELSPVLWSLMQELCGYIKEVHVWTFCSHRF